MHLFHIPQCSIQNRNMHISVLNGALWDMEQVHSGNCETDLLCNIHGRILMNQLVCDDRFSVIPNTFIRTSYTLTIHQYWSFSTCFNAILAHCIYQTNATSGFNPVALFKMSLRCNQRSKPNKKITKLILTRSHISCIKLEPKIFSNAFSL